MDSFRSGSGIPSRPLDGTYTRGTRDMRAPLKTPRSLSRTTKIDDISSHLPRSSGVRQPSKIAQPSTRRPSNPQQVTRPSLNPQPQSWNPSGAQPSTRPNPNRYGGSGSSSSSARSFSHTTRPGLNVPKPSSSSKLAAPRNETQRAVSSSRHPSRGSLDLAFGIHLDRGLTCSPAEIQVAEAVEVRKPGESPILYPELDRYRDIRRPSNGSDANIQVPFRLATHDIPPPTPASLLFSGTSGSPSTRFSESPGPGSHSRDTTPTSIASQSPSLISPFRGASSNGRINSPSQTRPPITRRTPGSLPVEVGVIAVDPQGLAAVRESLNSSSSNSTVREGDKVANKARSKRLPPPPPSPPPRKSSQKFGHGQDGPTPSRTVRKVSRPVIKSPSPERSTKPLSALPSEPSRAAPPSRPSRNGAPDLQSQLHSPMPIVHSNLSSQSLPTERRGSDSGVPNSLSPPPVHLSRGHRTASSSRLPIGGEVTAGAGRKLVEPKNIAAAQQSRVTRTPSPNVTSSFRFPFFGRKKTTDELQVDKDKGRKVIRKGPAAGTGHEGYGRLGAARKRSSSISQIARTSPGSQSSQDSFTSNDPFLAERISPVIIAGGGVIENRNTSSDLSRTDSSQSLGYLSKTSSEVSSTTRQAPRNALRPSPMSRPKPHIAGLRRPSESSDSDGATTRPTLALRRSVQRLRSSPDNPLRLPQPINTSGTSTSPMTSFDTSIMSDDSHFDLQRQFSRESEAAHPAQKKLVKRPKSPRKWNLFGRSAHNQHAQAKNEKVTATVKIVEKKPIPFYAMMDSSEQEDGEPMDVQEVLRYAEVYGKSPSISGLSEPARFSPKASRSSTSSPAQRPQTINRDNMEARSKARSPMIPPALRLPINQPGSSNTSASRPSRLPSVGRIPKVVSNRNDHASLKSFSRPFRASMQLAPQPQATANVDSIAKGPTPPKPSTPVPELTMDGSTIGSTNVASSQGSIPGLSPDPGRTEKEFIAFSPRKDSESTIGTSSSSCSGVYAFAEATAIVPRSSDPPAEDEVWDEYNDLLGEDNGKDPNSATSSKGIPFHLETYQSKLAREKPMESPTIVLDGRRASRDSKATTISSTCSADMTERLRAAFQPHPSPPTSLFMSGTVSAVEVCSTDEVVAKPAVSSRRSSQSSRKSGRSNASCSSDDASPLAQVNLRVGSMTVSKWLTFGHVLFSDIRHELVPIEGSLNRHSILVVDGLGNDDWSFYAAETYPTATFFNLSPRAPLPPELKSSSSNFPLSPPNHHQIQYLSHIDKFPFAPHSFTALVYRFPVAAPEAYYRAILNEARRVLKPGGFIELSILDVDLNNMGNRGRRTIRRLKERIREKTPEANLASTADLIVRLLGKAGFTTIKAARVGVPVASSATRSNTRQQKSKALQVKKQDHPSLAEMMSDNSPLADEGITKMVSRVGRWWYTRCYENAAENPSGRSIWSDRALLSECEELGTSLKLTVCCARTPLERVTSV